MADGTTIEWTDATWQIVTGCSVVSPGCTNCYAMRLAGTRLQHHHSRRDLTVKTKAGPVWNGKVRFNAGWLTQALHWKKPRDIFVAAHGDLFHDVVQRWMHVKVFAVMAIAQRHRFQVLTKRAANMRAFCLWLQTAEGRAALEEAARELGHTFEFEGRSTLTLPLPNVWLGVSVEDRPRAKERIPHLIETPAAVRWISAEPLLGHVDIKPWVHRYKGDDGNCNGRCCETPRGLLHWVVAGGESGPSARPMRADWVRSIRDQCAEAKVPFFFKQWGAWLPGTQYEEAHREADPDETQSRFDCMNWDEDQERFVEHSGNVIDEPGDDATYRVGKKAAGAMLDGKLHREMPR